MSVVRPRIIDRYIFRELIGPFFFSLAAIMLVLFIQKMFRLTELVIAKGVSLWSTLQLFFLIMPGFLVIAIPMSMLLASLIAFTRLSSDSEVSAMKASCMSLYGMLRPVALLSAVTCALTAVVSIAVLPASSRMLKEHMLAMVKSSALVALEPDTFSSMFNGLVIYVDKMKSADDLEGIFIFDERTAKDPYAITAKRGRLIADPKSLDVVLAMEDGVIHTSVRENEPYTHMSFDTGGLFMDINNFFLPSGDFSSGYQNIGTLQLFRDIRRARSEGKPSASMESELHTRFTIPFACLVFGLVGAPLGIRRSRTGKSSGILIAIAVFLGYYIVMGSSKNMAEAGVVSPAVAYWVPEAIITFAAIAVIYKKGREIDFGITNRITSWYYLLKQQWEQKEMP